MITKCAVAIAVAVGCAMVVVEPARAQMNTADAGRGRVVAARLCTGCHVTSAEPGATTANPDVPSFAAIARRPDANAERLAGRIIVPHPAMPDTLLTVAEIRDVIAYILAMKPAR